MCGRPLSYPRITAATRPRHTRGCFSSDAANSPLAGLVTLVGTLLSLFAAVVTIVVAIWAAWQLSMGFTSPVVANFAHLGGFVAGGLLGWVILPQLLTVAKPRAS